jgi:glyoxylate/hydroxypyruvate reductase A
MRNTILFYSAADDPAPWRTALEAALSEAAFHVFPDIPAPATATTAIVWSPPEGFFTPFTGLRLIVNLGAGADSLLRRGDLPDVPIIRLSDPGMVAMMTSYVLFAVIRYARDIDKFEAAQRGREWLTLPQRPLSSIKVGVLGLGELGTAAATALAGLGFEVLGWSRSPKALPGVASLHGMDALDGVIA